MTKDTNSNKNHEITTRVSQFIAEALDANQIDMKVLQENTKKLVESDEMTKGERDFVKKFFVDYNKADIAQKSELSMLIRGVAQTVDPVFVKDLKDADKTKSMYSGNQNAFADKITKVDLKINNKFRSMASKILEMSGKSDEKKIFDAIIDITSNPNSQDVPKIKGTKNDEKINMELKNFKDEFKKIDPENQLAVQTNFASTKISASL
jgi:hypothetical protein